MNIVIDNSDNRSLPLDNLISYLSQIVLTKIDDKIEEKHKSLNELNDTLNELKDKVRDKKDRLMRIQDENGRLEILMKNLNIINTLKQEGVLIGNNRSKISNILPTLFEQPSDKLKTLQSRLMSYLGVDSNRISVS